MELGPVKHAFQRVLGLGGIVADLQVHPELKPPACRMWPGSSMWPCGLIVHYRSRRQAPVGVCDNAADICAARAAPIVGDGTPHGATQSRVASAA